ncbi:hypothetical protein CCP2SC5_700011 [Azospirillaceae bacterium]
MDTLWQDFAAESQDHCDVIEPLLLASENEPATAEIISRLFRAMHSLKGAARAMTLGGMERLAHESEHLLGYARDGQASLDRFMIDVLLQAYDEIERLRALALADRQDAPPSPDVLARLAAARRKIAGPDADLSDAPLLLPSSCSADAEDATETASILERSERRGRSHAERVRAFVEKIPGLLLEIAALVGPAIAQPSKRRATLRALEFLKLHAEGLGFAALAQNAGILLGLVERHAREGGLVGPEREQALQRIADLQRMVAGLEAATGLPGATQALTQGLAAAAAPELDILRQQLTGALSGDALTLLRSDPSSMSLVARMFQQSAVWRRFLNEVHAADLLTSAAEFFQRAATRRIVFSEPMLEVARAVLAVSASKTAPRTAI